MVAVGAYHPDITFFGKGSDSLNVEYKNSTLSLSREQIEFASIGLGHLNGKVYLDRAQLKFNCKLSDIEVEGYEKGKVTISTRKSTRWCESLALDIFFNDKKVGYLKVISKLFSLEKKYVIIFKDCIDFNFIVMLAAYIYDSLNESNS